jgi:serine protease Do
MGTTSCLPLSFLVPNGDSSEQPDVNDIPDGATVNVNGGDSYNVTIQGGAPQTVMAANKALLSAVSIVSSFERSNPGWGGFGGSSDSSTSRSSGSGVIYKIDKNKGEAYVITNHHVVYDATYGVSSSIKVYLYGQEGYDELAMAATYVGGSLSYDIAILKITGSSVLMKSIATAATFADSNKVAVLDTVIAIGNAQGSGISATVGYVNVESEYLSMLGADEKTEITLRVIRTDAAVNPGNSGGGLFNDKGEVIGIVNAKSASDSVDNIGYAIPSNVAKSIANNIIDYCDGTNKTCVYRCLLGITISSEDPTVFYDTDTGKIYKSESVTVTEVTGSAVKGKLQSGDVLRSITINGNKNDITLRHHVVDSMLDARAGHTVVIDFIRGDVEMSITITITQNMIEAYK